MDCEKFDQHVIDALYDELDELTHAALKRHVEGCSRCAGIYTGLRATREVGILPIEEPSDDLEARILDAVALAQTKTPWPRKVLRGLAWAGSHAMRPQLAMAAVFVLVIGSSLLLLRAPPGSVQNAKRVTERGSPAAEPVELAPAATAAAAAQATAMASAPAEAVGGALAQNEERSATRRAQGEADQDKAKPEGSAGEARTALAEARAAREASGCSGAVSKFDAVAVRFAGTQAAADAMWDEANCFKQMGDAARSQQLYMALRSTGYRDRAEAQLAEANANANNMQNQAGRSAPAAVAAAPAAAPPASPPATTAAPPAALASAAPNEVAAKDRAAGAGPAPRAAPRPAAGAPNPRAPAAPARAPAKLDAYGY
jgi:hypothetical protein